jgi:endoplasmic reticulum-Golgi intermediate compartment protein 3
MSSYSNNGSGYNDPSFGYNTTSGYQPHGYYSASSSNHSNRTNPQQQQSSTNGAASMLRRRTTDDPTNAWSTVRTAPMTTTTPHTKKALVKKLDFMFPKVEAEYTVRTDKGGIVSLIAYCLICVLAVAEIISWQGQRNGTNEHISVDTSLGQRMRVNLDITFPALACEDLHIDIMDVAGDSQLDVEETMVKRRLNRKGHTMGQEELVEANIHNAMEKEKQTILAEPVPADYCGPCYGAHETETQCCNTCDELLDAYGKKRWRTDLVKLSSEQCIREGRDKTDAKPLKVGEGCNLAGYFMVNRVGGNFHIAMGEGVERDGRHIHIFNPEESQKFNASHIINHLSFGPALPEFNQNGEHAALDGVTKIVLNEHGTTGLFQYFIKIVPTTYVITKNLQKETNRFFFTERFRPLMAEYFKEDDYSEESGMLADGSDQGGDAEAAKTVAVVAGHAKHHGHADHHAVKKNSILPGVFFIYEIYPFAVQVTRTSVPVTHLLIRLLATVGGVFTIVRWADVLLHWGGSTSERNKRLGFV